MDKEPKPVVHPKIINVNILNLVLGTLRNKKNAMGVSCGGGCIRGASSPWPNGYTHENTMLK